ncbi:hypothetical protein BX616_005890 [Lobosporangium transversale]|nr:hypothetical protein BX616_005890 [Lobosporangium transversale]
MSAGALLTARILLVLLATVILVASAFVVIKNRLSLGSLTWPTWMPLILAILSDLIYSLSLGKRAFISRAVAWFVSPSYRINRMMHYRGRFLQLWNCGVIDCTLAMISDICGFLMGLFVLVELSLAYNYERKQSQKTSSTSIFVAPTAHQQTHYIQLEHQHQQQPVALSYPYQHQGYDQRHPLQSTHYEQLPVTVAYQPASAPSGSPYY